MQEEGMLLQDKKKKKKQSKKKMQKEQMKLEQKQQQQQCTRVVIDIEKDETKTSKITCPICVSQQQQQQQQQQKDTNSSSLSSPCHTTIQYFSSIRSLEDHMIAKHSGDHTYIQPDWAATASSKANDCTIGTTNAGTRSELTATTTTTANTTGNTQYETDEMKQSNANIDTNNNNKNNVEQTKDKNESSSSSMLFGSCSICDLEYTHYNHEAYHLSEFIPPPPTTDDEITNDVVGHVEEKEGKINTASSSKHAKDVTCNYCHKRFRDRRARMQHENYCKMKHCAR
eukprot:4287634-Ditylum_brightwellii.AAC.1